MIDAGIIYQNRVVVYIDILGFKAFVDKTIGSDGQDVPDAINRIVSAYNEIRDALVINPKPNDKLEMMLHENNVKNNRMVTIFSDTVVISFELNSPDAIYYVIFDVNWMLSRLIEKGVLCRGGVAYGKLIHDNNKVFGPALVEAYTLESKGALYPRVILGPEILDLVKSASSSQWGDIRKLVRKDTDGMFFVDYFGAIEDEFAEPTEDYAYYLRALHDVIVGGLKFSKPDLKVKYMWMKERYNENYDQKIPDTIGDMVKERPIVGDYTIDLYKSIERIA